METLLSSKNQVTIVNGSKPGSCPSTLISTQLQLFNINFTLASFWQFFVPGLPSHFVPSLRPSGMHSFFPTYIFVYISLQISKYLWIITYFLFFPYQENNIPSHHCQSKILLGLSNFIPSSLVSGSI